MAIWDNIRPGDGSGSAIGDAAGFVSLDLDGA